MARKPDTLRCPTWLAVAGLLNLREVDGTGRVDGALTSDGVVALLDEVQEGAGLRAERVRAGTRLEIELAVGGESK